MQASPIISLGLPLALVIIMLGLGLSLKLEDFTKFLTRPKPVIVGLVCHLLILPLLCLALIWATNLSPAAAVGMMLLAASPAGTSATIYTHLARGDVALSLTFAAVTTVLAIVTIPLFSNGSMLLFYGEGGAVYLGVMQILQFFAVAILPAMVGVLINSRFPELARRLDRPVKILAMVFLAAVVVFAIVGQWSVVLVWAPVLGAIVLTFNLVTLAVGYFVPRLAGVERGQAVALAMSISIHNAAIVIALALSEYLLNNAEMAIPPALYGVIAYITAAAFVWGYNRRQGTAKPA
ncbi:MAG: bile acid:sodium symporter family protein [Rhizobiaceae bacterium]|nr:bile acid:sodium symporter family protein [Rhizobiaceae bacterium]